MSRVPRIRTTSSLAKRLEILIKKYGAEKIIIDHGVSGYTFDHYEIKEGTYENGYKDILTIYVKDFDKNNSVIEYMSVTDDDLKAPTKEDNELVCCYWDKEYPHLLYMKEYQVGYRWL